MANCPSSVRLCVNNFSKQLLLWNHSLDFDQTAQEWSLGVPLPKFQIIPVGCISRSQGQKIGFQNAIFKNLVWNYQAQSFHIWYITSSRGPLPLCSNYAPGVKIDPAGGGVTIVHWIELYKKNLNDFFSWTANGNLTKLNKNDPWIVPYQFFLNGSDWLHKFVKESKKKDFQKSCLKLPGPELSYLVYNII